MRAYVISECGWEYNDENYYQTEHCDGYPVKVFLRKDLAVKEARRRERLAVLESLRGHTMGFFELNCDWNGIGVLTEDSLDLLKRHGLALTHEDFGWDVREERTAQILKVAEGLDDTELDKFVSTLEVGFYTVAEVELDDETLEPR